MSTFTDRAQPAVRPYTLDRAGRRAACAGADRKTSRRPTLDDMLVGAWEDLRATQAAECLVCGGTMLSRRGAGPVAGATGSCEDCGSVLS